MINNITLMLILIRKKIMLYNTLLSYYYPTGLRWYIYIYIYFFLKKKGWGGNGIANTSNATYYPLIFFLFLKIDVAFKITIRSKFNSNFKNHINFKGTKGEQENDM